MGLQIALALLGPIMALGHREVHVFERAAAKEISEHLQGETKVVEVKVRPDPIGVLWGAIDNATIRASKFSIQELPLFVEPKRSRAGRCGNLHLELSDFELRGLRVESLVADIPACRYDRGLALAQKRFRLSQSGVGKGTVRIRQEDLVPFILKKYHEIKNVDVKVRDNVVWVEGDGEFLIVKSHFTVIANLTPVSGTKLHLTEAKVWFDWRRADEFTSETLLKSLNPIVDFNQDLGLYDAISVDHISLLNGVITAQGKTKIPTR